MRTPCTPPRQTRPASARTIAGRFGLEVEGDASRMLCDVAPLAEAGPDDLSYLTDANKAGEAAASLAGCLIVPAGLADAALDGRTLIRHADPQAAFIEAMLAFRPPRQSPGPSVSIDAWVAPNAKLGEGVTAMPTAVVGEDARVGDRTVLHPGVVIGPGAVVGADCVLHAGAKVLADCVLGDRITLHANAVVGADGFGYRLTAGGFEKLPHTGRAVLCDDVEIGACATVDRGMVGDTVVGEGTKIDNQVQIAHNVRVGRHNALAAHVGVAGSSSTGDWVRMGGQSGIADHVNVGDNVAVGAKAAVMSDVPDGTDVHGIPARPVREQMMIVSASGRLPAMRRQLRELQKQVDELSSAGESRRAA